LAVKVKDLAFKKMFANHQVNNFQLPSSYSDIVSSFSGPKDMAVFSKASSIAVFSKVSSSLASIKEKITSINPFKLRDSKINLFYSSEHGIGSQASSWLGSPAFRAAGAQSYGIGQAAASGFIHDAKVTNVMAPKVSGVCPKIENNFNFGGYWKGFAHGSFGAWLTAWFLTGDKKEKEEKSNLVSSKIAPN
jgi:hypothetical protein